MTDVTEYPSKNAKVHEITSYGKDDNPYLALAKADYLNETVILDDPIKTTDKSDVDYIALLQMTPYHVDNVAEDGSALTKDPVNHTLRLGTQVDYVNATSDTQVSSTTYSMTKKQ